MTLLKQNLTGLGPVLRFSFAQLLKAKGNLITLGVFMLLALVSVPAAALFSSGTAPAPEPDYAYAAPEPDGEHLSVNYSIVSRSEHLDGSGGSGSGYFVQLIYSILVMMISMLSVSYIIGAVAEEKTSKLVELLMVSVKPLALIAGKILSVMLYMLMTIVLVALCFALSNVFSAVFLNTSASFLPGADGASVFSSLEAGALIAALVSLLLGYLTFAIAAGLFGAGCSSTEDTQGAAGGCTVLIMLAYFVSVVAGSVGGVLGTVCSLVPVLSVFCAPAQYAVGALSLPMLCLSWLIQAVCAAALAVLCAKIYAGLLIYRGGRVKLRQMLRMARGGKEAV